LTLEVWMPLKVIGAGWGRTGTMSLKTALEELGFKPCYHMIETLNGPTEDIQYWIDAAAGKEVDWEALFSKKGYQAAVDFPPAPYYRELMKAYPGAKVILTVREASKWWVSASETIYPIGQTLMIQYVFALTPRGRKMKKMLNAIWENSMQGRFHDRAFAEKTFEEYNERVKREVPAEKLLVFDVKEGWGPLCKFLGVEVPNKPFPHVNDTHEFKGHIRRLRIMAFFTFLIPLLLLLAVVWFFFLL